MPKLLVTADVHGFYTPWRRVLEKLEGDDILAVAGDLFGNKYPAYSDPDYQPQKIKEDFVSLLNEKYFVYGNCDLPNFLPGQKYSCEFSFNNKKIFLCHGDQKYRYSENIEFFISGHTHIPVLKKEKSMIYFNPGSAAKPGIWPLGFFPSCGIIENERAVILDLLTGEVAQQLVF